MVTFALIWLGEALLCLKFVMWVIHGSAALYFLMVPWGLFGLIMLVRPNWILNMQRTSDKALEQAGELFEKRPPPGFP